MQNVLRSLKNNQYFSEEDYKTNIPEVIKTWIVYGTAKLHKLKENDTVESLPLRPVISNVGTATYKTAKYLATLLSPLTSSEYNIKTVTNLSIVLRTQKFQTVTK